MALIIEEGSFTDEDAVSFIEISYADNYHSLRANSFWNAATDINLKEAALIRAFDYLMTRNWRPGIFLNEVPDAIKKAQAEGALRELAVPGSLSPDRKRADFVKKKTIDIIETIYTDDARDSFEKIDAYIAPFLNIVRKKITRILYRG